MFLRKILTLYNTSVEFDKMLPLVIEHKCQSTFVKFRRQKEAKRSTSSGISVVIELNKNKNIEQVKQLAYAVLKCAQHFITCNGARPGLRPAVSVVSEKRSAPPIIKLYNINYST